VEHDPTRSGAAPKRWSRPPWNSAAWDPRDLAAIGITNQRETTVLWNRTTGKPLYNALVWQDTRVADYIPELARAGGPDRFRAQTGLPLATYFSGLKIRWVLGPCGRRTRAGASGRRLFGTIDTFLLWHLTAEPRADSTSPIRPTPAARS